MTAPEKAEPIPAEERLWWFLFVLNACGNHGSYANDGPGEWVAAFCDDVEPTDTFNRACDLKLAICTHNSMDETSRIWITDAGKRFLADREARPSLPDSREEKIRAEAAEDERDRLLRLASARQDKASPLVQWLKRMGAMSPIKRHNERERKVETEGQAASFSHALDALEVMAAAIESDTHRDAKRYIGLDIHTSFPGMMPRIHSTERAIAFLDQMRPEWRAPRARQGGNNG